MRYAWLVIVAGCYTAPDYNGTHFKCDNTHACPNNQPCINGVCAGTGSGSNMPDAPTQSVGVGCGSQICTGTQICCVDFTGPPSCLANASQCVGLTAACDGKEDCGTGVCCRAGGTDIACAASCTAGQVICLDNNDCPSNVPKCCPPPTTFEPWGACNISCP